MNTVIRRLGMARIDSICAKYNLDAGDVKIVIEILDEWEKLIGQIEKKTVIAIEKTILNPKRSEILKSIMEITMEFSRIHSSN